MNPITNHDSEHARESVRRLVVLLQGAAYNLWSACLCSGPPMLRDLFEELDNPKPGDLVMETTTHTMKSRNPLEGIGTLVSVASEPMFTREQATDAGYAADVEIPTAKVWTITLDFDDGREFRWQNASFIKVKTDRIEKKYRTG